MTKSERARLLVVEQGLTYEQAAEKVGLSVSWVAQVAARDGWQDQRAEFLLRARGYEDKVRTVKDQALDRIIAYVDEAGD